MKSRSPKLALAAFLAAVTFGPTSSASAAQGAKPNVCERPCWGARAPKSSISQMSALTRAIIHHTADPNHMNTGGLEDSKANVRAVQNYHMDTNGWSDIGYHFLVDKHGYVFEGRSGSMTGLPKGAHDGTNYNSFGFNIMGYFHTPYDQKPTSAMLDSLMDVIAWRMPSGWSPYGSGTYNNRTVGYLDGHRKVKSTACPGDHVHNPYITEDYNGGPMRNGVWERKNGSSGVANGNRKQVERTPNGGGYWIVASDGGVFSFGNAAFHGSLPGAGVSVNNIIGMSGRPQADGYWLAGSDGGVFSFGGAPFHGSMGGTALSQPIVGIECTTTGNGYWLVGKDGGIFAFGDAPYHGSVPGSGISVTNIVGMERGPNNTYWILGGDGGIFSYGAPFHGSMGGQGYTDFVSMASKSDGGGYWLMRNNGSIYTFGSMNYRGGADEPGNFVSIAAGPSTWDGYWLLKKDGAIFSFGDAPYYGGAN